MCIRDRVIGPTSVGKSKMGVELAKALNGEIISGDSMQIYQGMDIGTAKVTSEEMENVIHHCIDILSPKQSYSVKDFQETVRKQIDEITSRGKLPIIVGGTGPVSYTHLDKNTLSKHMVVKLMNVIVRH